MAAASTARRLAVASTALGAAGAFVVPNGPRCGVAERAVACEKAERRQQIPAAAPGAVRGATAWGSSLGLGVALSLLASAAGARARARRARHGFRSRTRAVIRPEDFLEVTAMNLPLPAAVAAYGQNVFRGTVAEPYLRKHGLSLETLEDPSWCESAVSADAMAAAVLEWATDRGATNYCHWFQPMGSVGVRFGQAATVQNSMLSFKESGEPFFRLTGQQLLAVETDGSSYPNGGLRETHAAAAYAKIDPASPIFLRGDSIFIPACFVAYTGEALDEKTPLLRAAEALSREGQRLLRFLGLECRGLVNRVGLEQEFFLVPRGAYYRRPDLQFTGRTVMGKAPPRGQEMSDHYLGPLSSATPALRCIQEIQEECFRLGIPLRTRHREVAPGQFEVVPLFGPVNVQADQNLMVMQIAEETAARNGLACLFHEKPFAGVNGSAKHDNWSLWTDRGVPLLTPSALNEATRNPDAFAVVMAAFLSGVDRHGDLLRMAIASPGNEFRLGACEAPPSVMSVYLGEDMTDYLLEFASGEPVEYCPAERHLSFGVDSVAPVQTPAEDRNRSSPLAYVGGRFEFRAVGSSQNVSLVNAVLDTLMAEAFRAMADRLEAGEDAADVARELLQKHSRVIFNGNGYDPAWPAAAEERGLWRIDSGVEAICRLSSEESKRLFSEMGVFTPHECEAREAVLLEHYTGTVEIECKTMVEMLRQHVIPSAKNAGLCNTEELSQAAQGLEQFLQQVQAAATPQEAARLAHSLRLEQMMEARELCDAAEALVPPSLWTLAPYRELLFMDTHSTGVADPFGMVAWGATSGWSSLGPSQPGSLRL